MIYYININLSLEEFMQTTNALTEVTDHTYRSLDEGNYVFGIYIDLKKAFHTAEHQISHTNSSTTEYVVLHQSDLIHTSQKESNL